MTPGFGLPVREMRAWAAGFLAVVTLSCGGSDIGTGLGGAAVPTTIAVTPDTVTLVSLGGTAALTATVEDQGGNVMTGAVVLWSSSNEPVAVVSSSGIVTAIGNGTAKIAATAGVATDTTVVTVAQLPDTITVTPNPIVLNGPGDTLRVQAAVRDAGGSPIAGQVVTLTSSNTSVVTVSGGLLTAVATGTATIRAASGSLATSIGVTVTATPASVTATPTTLSFASLGDTARVTAVVRDASNVIIANASVVWSSSNASVATVMGGLVTATGNGSATVTATAGSVSATVSVTVSQVPISITITPSPIVLNGPGDTIRAVATVRDARGSAIAGQTVAWSSGSAAIATVTPQGLVTGVAAGTTTISATSGALGATVNVSVTSAPASITLAPDSVNLRALGDTARIVATVRDGGGNAIASASVTWSSSNTSVATVVGGLVTATGFGTATVTASAGSITATAKVVVPVPPSFSGVVNQIFIQRGCTSGSCHGGGSGGLTLTSSASANYAALVGVPASANSSFLRVKPKDSFNSYLVMKVEGRSGARMPIGGGPLSAAEIANIKNWIDAGAPNN